MKLVAPMSTLRRGACAVAIRPGLLVMIEHGDKVLPLRSSGRPLPATSTPGSTPPPKRHRRVAAASTRSSSAADVGQASGSRLPFQPQHVRRWRGVPAHRSHAARGAWRWQGCAQSEHTRAPPGREPGTGCFVSGRRPARV